MGKEYGVSETVGAIVLISVASLAVGIVILILFAGPLPTNVPSFTGLISHNGTTIWISHEGGDPLYVGQFKILLDGSDQTANFTKSLSSNVFSLGMKMNYTASYIPSRVVVIYNTSWGGGTILLATNLGGWYSTNWLYRMKITIDHTKVIAPDQTNFPVLISRTGPLSSVRSDGNDILFTDSTGTLLLPFEIENFSSTGPTVVAWVNIPTLSSTRDTIIYMYYGNPGASNSLQFPKGVWTSGYVAVWHLSNSFADSTGNGHTLVNHGTTSAAGQISYGRYFNGMSSLNITCGGSDCVLGAPSTVTVSGWANIDPSASDNLEFISLANSVSIRLSAHSTPYPRGFYLYAAPNSWYQTPISTPPTIPPSQWHYFTYVLNPGSSYEAFYVDNNLTGTTNYGTAIQYLTPYFTTIGAHAYMTAFNFTGVIDEVHISNTARSASWIQTEYNNTYSPGTFSTFGSEQTQGTMS